MFAVLPIIISAPAVPTPPPDTAFAFVAQQIEQTRGGNPPPSTFSLSNGQIVQEPT